MAVPNIDLFGIPINEHHREIRDVMLRFGEERLAPGSADRDRDLEFPSDLVNELAELKRSKGKTRMVTVLHGAIAY